MFNIRLNEQHNLLEDFDIFELVGHSVAHDENIPLSIKKGKLSVNGEFSTFNGVLKLELMKVCNLLEIQCNGVTLNGATPELHMTKAYHILMYIYVSHGVKSSLLNAKPEKQHSLDSNWKKVNRVLNLS